jgi:hypothetical protein
VSQCRALHQSDEELTPEREAQLRATSGTSIFCGLPLGHIGMHVCWCGCGSQWTNHRSIYPPGVTAEKHTIRQRVFTNKRRKHK